jgi:hypothetical protein
MKGGTSGEDGRANALLVGCLVCRTARQKRNVVCWRGIGGEQSVRKEGPRHDV